MNFFKKIDHYLLTNHPLLWRTKVHWFVLFSLVCNTIGFTWVYSAFNPLLHIRYIYSVYNVTLVIFCFQLLIFVFWLISQARMKISMYNFRVQVLTFLTYMVCVWLFASSFSAFPRAIESRLNTVFMGTVNYPIRNSVSKKSCITRASKIKMSKGLINNKTTYLFCRLFRFGTMMTLSIFLFLISYVGFRMWLLLLIPYFLLIFIHLSQFYNGSFMISPIVTMPLSEIVLTACLVGVFMIKKNIKLRQFLVFFTIVWLPVAILLLIVRFISLVNISLDMVEYIVKATMILLPLTIVLSTYLITKKNIMPA